MPPRRKVSSTSSAPASRTKKPPPAHHAADADSADESVPTQAGGDEDTQTGEGGTGAPVRPSRPPVERPTTKSLPALRDSDDETDDAPVTTAGQGAADGGIRGVDGRQQEPASAQMSRATTASSSDSERDMGPKTPPLQPVRSLPQTPSTSKLALSRPATPSRLATPLRGMAISRPGTPKPVMPVKRLMIHKMALINFKSYAGRVDIGPFHKSFSSIVGPNGSGKSNTIDALLFVFGYRANKMRQGKLSELIHNSEGRMDLESCSVEVRFREIIDMPGPDAYSVVPNSTLVVARTAYRNNTSKYTVNNKTSTFTEVTTLLRAKGIDLDHKRFLILQGEVESIAQMKPKAPSEHEDGLLEYLEDIIGTSQYKPTIETALAEVDRLNDERGEKMNRVKIVQREKEALAPRKKAADDYLRQVNEVTHFQNQYYQVQAFEARRDMEHQQLQVEEASRNLDEERASQAGRRTELEEATKDFADHEATFKALEKETSAIAKELAAHEREEAQSQEKRKHVSTKRKKLEKTVKDDTHALSEAKVTIKSLGEEIIKFTTESAKLERELESEEVELEKVRDSLKGKTEHLSLQVEEKQRELQPWAAKRSEKQAIIDIARSERDLLTEKTESAKKALDVTHEKLVGLRDGQTDKTSELKDLAKQQKVAEKAAEDAARKLASMKDQEHGLRSKATDTRIRAEEAKASQTANKSRSKVLQELTKLREMGRLDGFYGRLGSLGRIDDTYDVAISTAAPALENLVVDSIETGQACLDHLRRTQAGRAVIICLKALAVRPADMEPLQTPENAPRLFDLVTPQDPKYAAAFYSVLRDTLVATDLAQANRIAFGKKRWRVVTLDGKLVDISGTMSGGGSRVSRGAMSSTFAADEMSPEAISRLEKDANKAELDLKTFLDGRRSAEQDLSEIKKRIPELELARSKAEMDVQGSIQRIEDLEHRIQELKIQSKPDAGDLQKIAALDGDLAKQEKDLSRIVGSCSDIEQAIKKLQDKILEAGGIRLRAIQTRVEDLKGMIDHSTGRLTKAEVGKVKAEKDVAKLDKALAANNEALAALGDEVSILDKQIKETTNAANLIRDRVEKAQNSLVESKDELREKKEHVDELETGLSNFRKREVELNQLVEKARKTLKEDAEKVNHWQSKRQKLSLEDIDEDDEDMDDPDVAQQKPTDELRDIEDDELANLDAAWISAQITALEAAISKAQPNTSVLKEYRRREKEWQERAKDLEETTAQRDTAKNELDGLRKKRLEEFMVGFAAISSKLKEMYQLITLGGNAELELVDSLDPFSEGIIFSVMPPKKSWKQIQNLSGGEKTLSSLALVFALHVYKPTPLYFMDEIDAALDFRNVSIIANYIKDRCKHGQFIIISLRNNMFELASRLVGIYKTENCTKTVCIDNNDLAVYSAKPSLAQPRLTLTKV